MKHRTDSALHHTRSVRVWCISVAVLLAAVGWLGKVPAIASGSEAAGEAPLGPTLEGMGDLHHAISTDNPMTQRLFDQGLVLAYGFNHLEAERSFREAARLDAECAMCYWGIAFVRGPNINSMMDPENVPIAWEAMRRAQELADDASPAERDYIRALSVRYVEDPPEDRSELDLAYADAMRELARKYPADNDAATLFGHKPDGGEQAAGAVLELANPNSPA